MTGTSRGLSIAIDGNGFIVDPNNVVTIRTISITCFVMHARVVASGVAEQIHILCDAPGTVRNCTGSLDALLSLSTSVCYA